MQLAQVFAGPGDEVLVSRYCFAVYPIAAKAAGAKLVVADELPLTDEMPMGHKYYHQSPRQSAQKPS